MRVWLEYGFLASCFFGRSSSANDVCLGRRRSRIPLVAVVFRKVGICIEERIQAPRWSDSESTRY